jgi:ubiquinone/menaquinone biosynthesis C-methylase UbiE
MVLMLPVSRIGYTSAWKQCRLLRGKGVPIKKDYSIITELPQSRVPREQIERYFQRYKFASSYVRGKRVLEIGCGGGQGLSLLKQAGALSILGIDIEERNLTFARKTYRDDTTIQISRQDIHQCSMPSESFDCILMFEVIYYLSDARVILSKCKKMLSPGGVIIIESANVQWSDFNPSPFYVRYFSAQEMHALMSDIGFVTQLFSAYPTDGNTGFSHAIISSIKRLAIRFRLIPRSMKYKRFLKRIFFGKLIVFPSQLHNEMFVYDEPKPLDPVIYNPQFKVLYAVGKNNV